MTTFSIDSVKLHQLRSFHLRNHTNPQDYHTFLISKICAWFEVLRLRK